jgi:phosphate-selective porin OprO/OprP
MKQHAALSCALLLSGLIAPSPGLTAQETTRFDKAWNTATLYNNKENRILQELSLVGRLQIDAVWLSPDTLEKFNDVNFRRARLGLKADIFTDWTVHIEADWDLNHELDAAYTKLTDANIAWSHGKYLKVKALKQSAGFTLDGATSSKRLLTLERNNLSNNLWFSKEYFTGLSASGTLENGFNYRGGIFSSGGDPELDFDSAGWFALLSLGHAGKATRLRADYVYQHEDQGADTSDFESVASVNGQWVPGPFGIAGDLAYGWGLSNQGQSDIWGFAIQPHYDISKQAQAVLRYTYLESDKANGLRLPRYENTLARGRGDSFNELYAGFNLYFYDHKFKWQTGVSWVRMDDEAADGGQYEGWNLTSGLRIYW